MAVQRLGHADPKLTARVYSHVEVEDLQAAVATWKRGEQRSIQRVG